MDHSCSGWLLIIGNLRLCRFLTGNFGLLFHPTLVISVGVDNVLEGLGSLYVFTVQCQRLWHGRRTRQTLARITLFGCVLGRRPALIRFRPYLGRGEGGGEDSMRFPMSACKHWHKKETRVYGCLRVTILLMVRGPLIRTRTRGWNMHHVCKHNAQISWVYAHVNAES